MKKKLLFGLAFAALAAGGCFLAVNTPPRHQFTPDEIANIEALSEQESGWEYSNGIESGRFSCGAKLPGGGKCTFQVITCQGGGSGCNSRKCNLHG